MSPRFSAAELMGGLTRFQRNTVAHVMDRFHGADATDRFLVADQTGLGKTMVARGVIARTIEHLQDRADVDRIDVVYVCSNADLARQNLRKLNVTGQAEVGIPSRLTLLGKHSRFFVPVIEDGPRLLNLVSFTPGTSFSRGWASGTAEERAMLYLLLEPEETLGLDTSAGRDAALILFRGAVATPERFGQAVDLLRHELGGVVERSIAEAFGRSIRRVGDDGRTLLGRVEEALEDIRGGRSQLGMWGLVGDLRATLARDSVSVLTPDLVILDEFQRFRDLLNPQSEAGELAHHLFNHHAGSGGLRTKVLLLSATPYKPFTYAEEADDEHRRDFLEVISFLSSGGDTAAGRVNARLREYRESVVTGRLDPTVAAAVRDELLRYMVRTERPESITVRFRNEVRWAVPAPTSADLLGFRALRRLAGEVDAPISVEYWKSAPYFVNFMDGYKVGALVRAALDDPIRAPAVREALSRTRALDPALVERNEPIDLGNARLRELGDRTLGKGWWKLLWVPPSLPYLEPGGPYADPDVATMSKLLVFSAWAATPTAVASLLSYEADRLTAEPAQSELLDPQERARNRRVRAGRLNYRWHATQDRPGSMSTLALFWPMPGLADVASPRRWRREVGQGLTGEGMRRLVAERLRPEHRDLGGGLPAAIWFEAFRHPGLLPEGLSVGQVIGALSGAAGEEAEESDAGTLLARHVAVAMEVRGREQDRSVPEPVLGSLADLAANAPGNIAYRALGQLLDGSQITPAAHWAAAARLATALRTLFSRPETTLLLDQLYPDEADYWRRVVRYCEDGNLQACLDEYLHHLAAATIGPIIVPEELDAVVAQAAEALTLRTARYRWFDVTTPDVPRTLPARFALRYGDRFDGDDAGSRAPQVRQAFNSPFWPFVLASTSVGQEGIDLHWWCHALLHWNTPPSPVDFEQREGRVDRYGGLAIRRNIAHAHAEDILAAPEDNPWVAAYRIAADTYPELGAFSPHWVYPGPVKVERHVAPFALSVEQRRLEDVKRDTAFYRLTFGQPRQEDMLQILHDRLEGCGEEEVDRLRLDLRAPENA